MMASEPLQNHYPERIGAERALRTFELIAQ